MADESPNPYQPSAFLSDGNAKLPPAVAAAPRRPSRAGAILLSLFAFSGAGLYVLNRPRRFAVWLAAGLAAATLMVVAARYGHAKLFLFALPAVVVIWLAALTDTIVARPGEARPGRVAWPFVIALIVAAQGSAQAVKHWLVEAFQIPAGSMVPALLVGDHIFVKKGRTDVARGDVVVFEFPLDRRTDYVKRVVAIGGDTIEVKNGIPLINGVELAHDPIDAPCSWKDDDPRFTDPWTEPCTLVHETNAGHAYTIMLVSSRGAADYPRTVVPRDHVFVMGDNRDNSYDSRKWGFVPVDHIKGKVSLLWYSKGPRAGVRWSRIGHVVE
jgi:signal peptidase I